MAPVTVPGVELDTLGRVGEALANPVRRAVLVALLEQGSAYPSQLADQLGTTRQVLSNHLACLRGCGFVAATYEGRRVRYALAGPAVAEALTRLAGLPLDICPEDAEA